MAGRVPTEYDRCLGLREPLRLLVEANFSWLELGAARVEVLLVRLSRTFCGETRLVRFFLGSSVAFPSSVSATVSREVEQELVILCLSLSPVISRIRSMALRKFAD